MANKAFIVTDLGFGDSGGGSITEYLVRKHNAPWVVRYNGGSQAGHNVVLKDGRHHTFSQFGCGTFAGAQTYLSKFMMVNPAALIIEANHLRSKGVENPLSLIHIDADCLLITPYHIAANRIREALRGDAAHGTCGSGIGETVAYSLISSKAPPCARHLKDAISLMEKLRALRVHLVDDLRKIADDSVIEVVAAKEWAILRDPSHIIGWINYVTPLANRVVHGFELLSKILDEDTAVFEKSQGVLLDEWDGFHPHTTWSTCTSANAIDLLEQYNFRGEIRRVGVLRSYLTRHGKGSLPTETDKLTSSTPEPHNVDHGFQGRFRRGWFDSVLARYAIEVNRGIDELAITHLDAPERYAKITLRSEWRVCLDYGVRPISEVRECSTGRPWSDGLQVVSRLRISPRLHDLDHSSKLTNFLRTVKPSYDTYECNVESTVHAIQAALNRAVNYTSVGPTFEDKREINL